MENRLRFLFILIALIASNSVCACSCLQFDLLDRFNDSESVFIAKLSAAKVVTPSDKKEWPYVEGTFKVTNIFKGSPAEKVILQTGTGGGDCGIQMSVTRKYIIFMGNNEYIGICGGSATINPYDEDELAKRFRSFGAKSTSNR